MSATAKGVRHPPGLKTTQACRILSVHPDTLRQWHRAAGMELFTRTAGGHRMHDRKAILAMRDARDQGFQGANIVRRAADLIKSGRYDEPKWSYS